MYVHECTRDILIGPLCEKSQFVRHICTCIHIYTYINAFLYTYAIYCWASLQQAHDLDIHMYTYTYIRIYTHKCISNYTRKIKLGLFAKSAQFVEHLCKYVCIYAYIYAYIYTYRYTNIIVFPYIYVFPYMYAVCFWASLRKARCVTYTCIYIYTCINDSHICVWNMIGPLCEKHTICWIYMYMCSWICIFIYMFIHMGWLRLVGSLEL